MQAGHSSRRRTGAVIAGLAFGIIAAAPVGVHAQTDSAGYITRLGTDTLAIERFVRTPERVEAEVLLRIPSTTRTTYVMELGSDGTLRRLESHTFDPKQAGSEPVRRSIVERTGDSLRIRTTMRGETREQTVAAPAATLPFIDMVHWPYEIALIRARAASVDVVQQPLLSGSRTSNFAFGRVGADSMTITHPSRGTMRVRVDADGRLLGLDAGATTRKLIVTREPWMPIEGYAERWAALDAAGKSLGALSGRGETKATVAGANILVDFGTPAKRGREIWGKLVPYGEVWRTGANQATHFTTDRDLVLGTGTDTLRVPAGQYTLFSVPAADGGVLIVNRQTGITGTAHNPAHDLGRVRMTPGPLSDPVEVFDIAVTPGGDGGAIRLRWDEMEMVVPFVVR
ncbi:MAG TPA: DUF2911 domain-containing protein [Gemmatimonadaceae bacterium]|nr:DUF2911 domain-containing protein [Gemmatimonadaceae bacterium]